MTVTRKGAFLTDSMLEAHRINSPYLLEGKDRQFFDNLKAELGGLEEGRSTARNSPRCCSSTMSAA